ncbi:hypothetical protein C0Q70_14114 [Pomacea canaliculata]|uniref:Globin n=1 Tax=Pomacea canaliculata TaxID=400727 RepID=A0A2T7NZ39_POMCA|nr:hypothetical protein C0Q70_14114 [Pomacea canaliculata]
MAVGLVCRLFKSNASLQTMFHGFKHLHSDDELRSNEALEHHATLVMTTLDDAITHIDNFDYVSEVLRKTGASHVRFAGFTPENFWVSQTQHAREFLLILCFTSFLF